MHRSPAPAPSRPGWVHDARLPALVATLAALLRLAGLLRPVRADEAGFVLVARAWQPSADSLYGAYWVDRAPPLLALVRAVDGLAGPLAIRVVGALGCALAVLLAARLALLVGGRGAVGWTVLATGALLVNPQIDLVAAKGELLALPLLLGAMLAALLGVRRAVRERLDPAALARLGLAGLLGMLAVSLKQSLLGGLVFAVALVVAAALVGSSSAPPAAAGPEEEAAPWRRLAPGHAVALLAALAAGAAVPVLATVAWAVAAGVRLEVLWYVVVGFRADASAVLAAESLAAPAERAALLALIALGTGLLPLLAVFVAGARGAWSAAPAVTAATALVLAVDLVGLVLGGSFWRDYLFPLVPGTALAVALVAGRPARDGRRDAGRWCRALVLAAVASAAVSLVVWAAWNLAGLQELDEAATGEALAAVAEPGDTLVVHGGRADLQLESGLRSPYRFLWSLPMRALDPDRAELRALLTGPEPPTWLVEWAPFSSWDPAVAPALERVVEQRYVRHGTACGDRPVYLLRGLDRPVPSPDC